MRYTYTVEYYSARNRNKIGFFVELWMDLESIIQSDVSQKEKNKYINAYMWNLEKMIQINLFVGMQPYRMDMWAQGRKGWQDGLGE